MVKTRRWDFLIHLIFISLFLTACTEEDCLSDNSSLFFINFIDSSTEEPVQQNFTQIEISGISTPFQGGPASSQFVLPVNPHADQTTYTFITETTTSIITEQITISYTRKPQILSSECPYEIVYENLDVIESTFTGETRIIKRNLSNSDISNVTIFK